MIEWMNEWMNKYVAILTLSRVAFLKHYKLMYFLNLLNSCSKHVRRNYPEDDVLGGEVLMDILRN